MVDLLGAADAELLFDTTDALLSGNARGALEAVERLARSGRDPGQFARDLIAHLRQLLVARTTGEVPESFTVTVAQPERLEEQAREADAAKLVGAIDSLSSAVAAMREGDDPRLTLEVALLKVATPSLDASREALLRRIESLESQLTDGGAGAADSAGSRSPMAGSSAAGAQKSSSAPAPPAEDAAPDARKVTEPPQDPEPEARVATATIEIERVVELWPAVVDHLRESGSAMLSTLFDEARPLGIDEERSRLRIGFPPSAKFNRKKAESPANVERIGEAITAIVGQRLRPAYELIEEGGSEEATAEGSAALSEDDMIEMIKDNFDAREVEPDDARESEAG